MLRSGLVAASLVLAFTTACRKQQQPAAPAAQDLSRWSGPRLYITNEVSGDLSIVDATSMRLLTTIPLGKRPRGIHASPDHRTLYIALSGTPIAGPDVDESTLPPPDKSADGIGVFDVAQSKIVRTISGGSDPENFDVSPDGREIFISNEDASAVSIVDIAAGKVSKSFPTGAQ
ncbi:MAG TPA: beta-propeller fold lactonase family protein, partial [Acidobacteriaceae bacterium]|nr:beta-propeller fold lactonase family protein [Acidobacteriaceae bacterium]